MTRSEKEKILSPLHVKSPKDKILDGQKSSYLDGGEQYEKLKSLKKLSKDSENRVIQQRECLEETEIKRCYGGEENEEKSDPTKDETPYSFTRSLSFASLSHKDTKESSKRILKTHVVLDKISPKQRPDAFPPLDNKLAEVLDKRMSSLVETTAVQMPENKTQEQNWDKETYYFNTINIMDCEQKESPHEQNNLSRYSMGKAGLRSEAKIQVPKEDVVMCMAVNGIPESNLFAPYSREDQQTWNIHPFDQEDKNLQKHVSNIFLSLKNEISPLAAGEGIDEKSLNNTLTTLWKKLHSTLTHQQFSKVMDAIEMKKGGKCLPSFLDCFKLLSTGGDLDWRVLSGRTPKKDECLINLRGQKEDTSCYVDEKIDLAEKTEKMKVIAESAVSRQVEDKTALKKEIEKMLNLDEKDINVDDDDGLLSEEHALEKDLAEVMEKNADKNDVDDRSHSPLEMSTVADGYCRDTQLNNHTHGDLTTDVDGKTAVQVFRPSCIEQTMHDEKENVMKTNRKDDFEMVNETAGEHGLDQGMHIYNQKRNWHCGCHYKSGPGQQHSDAPKDDPLFISTEDKLDVRVKYFRTKSCMDKGGQGGGNSSWGGNWGSSHGRSFNGNDSEKDGRGYEDGNSSNSNNNDRDNNAPGPDNSLTQPRNQMVDTNIPGQDYKAVRKKHSKVSDEQLIDLLGSLSPDTSPNIQEDPGLLDDVNQCLFILLHALPNESDAGCSVCSVLHSLLIHFAGCKQVYKKCHICWQLLRIGLYHVQKCIKSGKDTKESPSDVCYQLLKAADFKTEIDDVKSERLWMKMKKYVGSVFHPPTLHSSEPQGLFSVVENEESNFTGLQTSSITSADQSPGCSLTSTGSAQVGRGSFQSSAMVASSANGSFVRSGSIKKFQASLTSIPESPLKVKGPLRQSGRKRSSIRRFSRQSSNESTGTRGSIEQIGSKSDDGSLTEGAKQIKVSELQSQSSIGELQNEGFLSLPNPTEPSSSRSSFGALDDISVTTSISSASGQNEEGTGQTAEDIIYTVYKPMMDKNENVYPPDRSGKVGYSQDPYETQKTYGPVGVMSLPIRPNIALERDQLLSLETAPTGEPGIGEVVYGTRRQIMKVAMYWARIRGNMEQESYKHQIREEGVILDSAKKHLRILRTRYQKKHQWMRLVHLGNGVAGKCHLAQDTTSSFNFCVKRVHIAKYEENELMTWSDLDHTNIVKLYGAIRHGCKIYIFCEFIAGGSLTSLINEQRSLNRRLSHWMCLRYFKQLLQVLIYLKSRNVLHEDLKADNILIKRNTTLIAVTDFGLARRMNVDSEMKGMSPTGSQTQWSPEKATSNGHGFAADVWAAVCILVHMLSGYPPWTKRYPGLQMLHFVIFTQSPPLADVPNNIQEVMRDLITQAFIVDPTLRPSASDLLRHEAFKILDQGAPESYYSTLISNGQAIPNNMLDNSNKGPQEMEEILVSLAASSQNPTQASNSQSSGSLHVEDKPGSESSLPETSVEMTSVIYQHAGTHKPDGMCEENKQGVMSGEASGSDQAASRPQGPFGCPEGAAGAIGGDRHEGNSLQIHYSNLPVMLFSSLMYGPDGAEGGSDLCSGYATSPDSFEDPDACVNRFLSDDIPFQAFTTVPQQLKLYQPQLKNRSNKKSDENSGDASEEHTYPRWSLLLGDQTYSGIDFVDEPTADQEIQQPCGEGEEVQEFNTEHPVGETEGGNTPGHSSRESSIGARSSSHMGSCRSSDHQSPAPTSDPGYVSPSEMQSLQVGMSTQSAAGHLPVAKTPPEDPFPTSYYPPSNLFEEQIDSGDLFGDPSQNTGHVSILKQSPLKGKDLSQISSLETHISSGVHKSGSSSSKSVCFDEEIEHKDVQPLQGSSISDMRQFTKPRSASAPYISVFTPGTADNTIEPGKYGKDCPIYSRSIDLPDDVCVGISTLRETDQEEERTVKKNPGLTLDVNLTTPKKYRYQRNQSTPAVSRARAGTDIPHPKTCPGGIESVGNLNTSKKTGSSSGIGTSLSGEVRHNSSRGSDTSGVWTPEKGRHSSAEMSPSTPKSQFDHQEREFSALEKASQSDVSGHEQDQMLAIADLQEQGESDVHFGLGPPEPDSFEDQLASIQKQIKDDEHKDLGHKYRLMRDDNTPLSPIRVPAKYEEWREVIDLIRQVVTHQGFEHFTLKYANDVPVDYNAPLTKGDLDIKVCMVQEDLIGDHEGYHNCWCERHEDQLRAMA